MDNNVEYVFGLSLFLSGREIRVFIKGLVYVLLAVKIRTFARSAHLI
jgi:hypothetical protein